MEKKDKNYGGMFWVFCLTAVATYWTTSSIKDKPELEKTTIRVTVKDKDLTREWIGFFTDTYALKVVVEAFIPESERKEVRQRLMEGRPVGLLDKSDRLLFYGDKDALQNWYNRLRIGGTFDIIVNKDNKILDVREN